MTHKKLHWNTIQKSKKPVIVTLQAYLVGTTGLEPVTPCV